MLRSLRGGAAKGQLQLDSGRFRLGPPRATDRPAVTADKAACSLLATTFANTQIFRLATAGTIAIGYGRLTLDPSIVPPAREPTQVHQGKVTPPVFPTYRPYRDRLAWLAVLAYPTGCAISGNGGDASGTAKPPERGGQGRIVVILDAMTGGNGVVYHESPANPCDPSVNGPQLDRATMPVSVSWQQHGPATAAGLPITASLLPCDGYTDPVFTSNGPRSHIDPATFTGPVRVVAQRPLGADCGSARRVRLTVKPPTSRYHDWAKLTHAPTGLWMNTH